MRGKKYKARDKTVKKSSRDGLIEVNLHSRQSVKISSRETDSLVRTAPDSVNLQETDRQRSGRAAGRRKPRRRRNRMDGPAKPEENTGRQDGAKEKPRHDAAFAAGQMGAGSQIQNSVYALKPEKESAAGNSNGRPPNDRLDGPFYGQEAGKAGVTERNSGGITDERLSRIRDAGAASGVAHAMQSGNKEAEGAGADADGINEKPDNVQYHEKAQVLKLVQDGVAHVMQSENKEAEAAGADADGMDERPDNGLYPDKTQVLKPAHGGRGENLQRQIFEQSARMGKIREQPDKRRRKKGNNRNRRKENAWQNVLREETDGRHRKHSYTAGNDSGPETQAAGSRNGDKDISSGKGTGTDISDSKDIETNISGGKDIDTDISGGKNTETGIPSCGRDTGQGIPAHSSGQKNIRMQRGKQRQRSERRILTEQKKPGDCRTDVLNDRYDRRDAETKDRAVDAAGHSESSGMMHDKKRSRTEKKGRKYSRKLIVEDKDNGMIRGAGMGIIKRAAPSVFHTVEESGNITAEDGSDDAEPKNIYKIRRSRAAAGLRNTFRRSARSSLYRHSCPEENRAGMQAEKEAETVETADGRKSQQGQAGAQKRNDTDKAQAEKKTARRRQQKQRNKRAYQTAARDRFAAGRQMAVGPVQSIIGKKEWAGAGKKRPDSFSFFKGRKNSQWAIAAVFLFFMAVMSLFSSCSILFQGVSGIAGTTYPSSDEDIYAVEAGCLELENALDGQVNSMEAAHPGYDEYRYQIDEISHNPYQLISYLTAACPGFTSEQADGLLHELFESQYHLTVGEQTEFRTDPDSGEIYEWHILCISLVNRGIDAVAHERLTPGQEELYKAYNLTSGNRSYLFGETADNGGDFEAQIPGDVPEIPNEALSDQRFANMMDEAEKYIGYPYVWGGSSPETSFDCSGFVSWVINHCGNGWNVGRQTAEGLRGCCTYVSPQEARPGDLIFFQGTYQTAGASHVGIYVGNNRMLHCGNPIQFTDLGAYWELHFLQYGRLP